MYIVIHLHYITILVRFRFDQCARHELESFGRYFDKLNGTASQVNFTCQNRTFSTNRNIGTSPLLHNGIFSVITVTSIFARRLLTIANFCRSLSREWKQNSLTWICLV